MNSVNSFSTTDNNIRNPLSFSSKEDFENLERISNRNVKDILDENNSNILMFPQDWKMGVKKSYGETLPVCSLYQKSENSYELKTGNIMGYVGVTNKNGYSTQLTINSRFENGDNDFFLNYMLAKVCNLNVVNLKSSTGENDYHNLLIYLFPRMLNDALSQGLYKQYQLKKYNDANVKGPLDVTRHIRFNIPFAGKIAYNAHEYSYDNNVTQLIRHTIECIRCKESGSYILNSSDETKQNVAKIMQATSSYKKFDLQKVLQKNQKQISHPYFTKYRTLQILCKMILQNKFTSFGESKNKIYGILFDGAWLWEEYIATVLKENNSLIEHKTSRDKLFVHDDEKRNQGIIPDFIRYVDKPHTASFIGDTKYQHIDSKGSYNRENYFQIITYMYRYSCKTGYLIFPYDKADKTDKANEKVLNDKTNFIDEVDRKIIDGIPREIATEKHDSKIIELGLQIPQQEKTFSDFANAIEASEKLLLAFL